jgi:heme exporter protein D
MNWQEFFNMGGYALYVWGSYGVTALLLGIEVLMLRDRRKRALTQAQQNHFGGASERAA